MSALDFTEIPLPTGGASRDAFEMFAREVLHLMGFKIVEGPDRGADDGRDLIVEELRSGIAGETRVRWLVSCKHKAHSGSSVNPSDEPDIQDRLNTHQCTAFLGFYSTVPSSGLSGKLTGAIGKYEHQVFDPARIERVLLGSTEALLLAKRYFPKSVSTWQSSTRDPAKIFADPVDLKCEHCSKSLLFPEPHGILTQWHPYTDEGVERNKVKHVYFSCKGNCDQRLRAPLHAQKMIDGWEDISDLVIPTVYIRWVMSMLNELQEGKEYSPLAFDKMKDLFLNIFPIVCRHPSEEDYARISALQRLPAFLGGLGS